MAFFGRFKGRALGTLCSFRRSSSILPKLSFESTQWPSTLSSTKSTVDLDNLEVQLKAKGVKYVLPSFIDMHGIPKAKMVPLDHLHGCCRGSELFTGAAVDGVPQAVSDDEVCAVADPATMAVPLPYRRNLAHVPSIGQRPCHRCGVCDCAHLIIRHRLRHTIDSCSIG